MNLRHLDLNLLLVLDTLLVERNVTRAAARLGVSQSTVSAALAKLRMLFDDDLFIKQPLGMQPTPRALSLQGPLAEVMAAIQDSVLSQAAFDPARAQRTFVLVLGELGQILFAPRLVQFLRQHAPGVSLKVVSEGPSQRLRLLESGEAELAIGYFPEFADGPLFQQKLYAAQPFVCLARRGHPVLGVESSTVSMGRFAGLEHAVVGTEGGYPLLYEPTMRRLGITRRVAIELPGLSATPGLLLSSDLVALVPQGLAVLFCREGKLVAHGLDLQLPLCEVRQFWHRRLHHDPGLVWLRQSVSNLLQPT
jgi:DNA-binding transcriptional LysR family regulator